MENEKRVCKLGDKCLCKYLTLPPIANFRKNGSVHHLDYQKRPYHKKCYVFLKQSEAMQDMQKRIDLMNIFG